VPLVSLALGSNVGDRLGNLRGALERLQESGDVRVLRASPVYENRAIGMGEADDFLNAVVELHTSLAPEALLDCCLEVEQQLGRERKGGWAPRTIDLDLVAYEGVVCATARLNLPHPRIAERDFVAVPLRDLAPDLRIGERTVAEIAACLPADGLRSTAYSLLPEDKL
jgi:2-amino-4-hydroxy-6-hydroxymethyldihydropteridine diphosphokinase